MTYILRNFIFIIKISSEFKYCRLFEDYNKLKCNSQISNKFNIERFDESGIFVIP